MKGDEMARVSDKRIDELIEWLMYPRYSTKIDVKEALIELRERRKVEKEPSLDLKNNQGEK
jgi:hypothetical protein